MAISDPADSDLAELKNWIRSCAGCGMCEHQCPDDYPLFSAIVQIRHALVGARRPNR
jgi:Fe-S oxidoreductase